MVSKNTKRSSAKSEKRSKRPRKSSKTCNSDLPLAILYDHCIGWCFTRVRPNSLKRFAQPHCGLLPVQHAKPAANAKTQDGVLVVECVACSYFVFVSLLVRFGDHTKGVYVSRHPDYTMFYQKKTAKKLGDEPVAGDEGSVIMFNAFAGKMKYFPKVDNGAAPTPGYHSHGSPNQLEIFIFNPVQVQ